MVATAQPQEFTGPLNEVLENIQKTAVDAAGAVNKVQVIELPGEPDYVYGVVTPDGKLERRVAEPEPRDHRLVSLAEAVLFATDKGTPEKSVIWFDRDRVAIVLDDETRRDRAALPLNYTPQMELLIKIEADAKKYDQQAFRRLLRIDLADCRPDDVLLNWVSDMRFTNAGSVTGRLEHGRESMGKDLEVDALSDIGNCPEMINLSVRVFDDPSLMVKRQVRCAVEILPKEQAFRLVPLPLELDNAIELEMSDVGESLRKAVKCKVFRGTP